MADSFCFSAVSFADSFSLWAFSLVDFLSPSFLRSLLRLRLRSFRFSLALRLRRRDFDRSLPLESLLCFFPLLSRLLDFFRSFVLERERRRDLDFRDLDFRDLDFRDLDFLDLDFRDLDLR